MRRRVRRVVRRTIIRLLAPSVQEIVWRRPYVWGSASRVHLALTAEMANTLFNTTSGSVYVSEHAFAGHNVSIITGTHDLDVGVEHRAIVFPTSGSDVHVGRGAWLGSGAIILGPCRIGDGAVVAAGAVVLGGTVIPANALWAGVPARQVRMLASPEWDSGAPPTDPGATPS